MSEFVLLYSDTVTRVRKCRYLAKTRPARGRLPLIPVPCLIRPTQSSIATSGGSIPNIDFA